MTVNSMPWRLSLSINFVLAKAAPGVKTPPLQDSKKIKQFAGDLQHFPL